MKKKILKPAFFFLFLFILTINSTSESLKGWQLSKATFDYLSDGSFNPERKNISENHEYYPFNIEVNFMQDSPEFQQNASGRLKTTLILAFTQEDAFNHKEIITSLLDYLKSGTRNFNIKVSFTAGDEQSLPGNEKMSGTNIFCSGLKGAENISAILFSFSSTKITSIIPGKSGKASPEYLVQLLSGAAAGSGIPYVIRGNAYLSLYNAGIFTSTERLSTFIDSEIPAAELSFLYESGKESLYTETIKETVRNYDISVTEDWCTHYIPLKTKFHFYWIGEKAIILFLMAVTAVSIFIICDFTFLFRKRKSVAAKKRKYILRSSYILPVTLIIFTAALYAGQYMTAYLHKCGIHNLVMLFCSKVITAFIIVSVIFIIEVIARKGSLNIFHYEYLLTLVSIVNIFLFSLIDISLSITFAIEYVIIYISRTTKKVYSIAFFCLLFIVPFIPVMTLIAVYTPPEKIHSFIYSNLFTNILLAFAACPVCLMWLRILGHLTEKLTHGKLIASYIISTAAGFILMGATSFGAVKMLSHFFRKYAERPQRPAIIRDSGLNEKTAVKVYETKYYNGIIRNIEINSKIPAERFTVSVLSEGENPVYYSNDDREIINSEEFFMIPDNPPETLKLSYMPDSSGRSTVKVQACYKDDGENKFVRETFFFDIDGNTIRERPSSGIQESE